MTTKNRFTAADYEKEYNDLKKQKKTLKKALKKRLAELYDLYPDFIVYGDRKVKELSVYNFTKPKIFTMITYIKLIEEALEKSEPVKQGKLF